MHQLFDVALNRSTIPPNDTVNMSIPSFVPSCEGVVKICHQEAHGVDKFVIHVGRNVEGSDLAADSVSPRWSREAWPWLQDCTKVGRHLGSWVEAVSVVTVISIVVSALTDTKTHILPKDGTGLLRARRSALARPLGIVGAPACVTVTFGEAVDVELDLGVLGRVGCAGVRGDLSQDEVSEALLQVLVELRVAEVGEAG